MPSRMRRLSDNAGACAAVADIRPNAMAVAQAVLWVNALRWIGVFMAGFSNARNEPERLPVS